MYGKCQKNCDGCAVFKDISYIQFTMYKGGYCSYSCGTPHLDYINNGILFLKLFLSTVRKKNSSEILGLSLRVKGQYIFFKTESFLNLILEVSQSQSREF